MRRKRGGAAHCSTRCTTTQAAAAQAVMPAYTPYGSAMLATSDTAGQVLQLPAGPGKKPSLHR